MAKLTVLAAGTSAMLLSIMFDGGLKSANAQVQSAAPPYILMVTWFTPIQPPNSYQVTFSSADACDAAKQQVMADAERLKQAKIEQGRQLPNFGVEMGAVAGLSAPYVSAVCAKQ